MFVIVKFYLEQIILLRVVITRGLDLFHCKLDFAYQHEQVIKNMMGFEEADAQGETDAPRIEW